MRALTVDNMKMLQVLLTGILISLSECQSPANATCNKVIYKIENLTQYCCRNRSEPDSAAIIAVLKKQAAHLQSQLDAIRQSQKPIKIQPRVSPKKKIDPQSGTYELGHDATKDRTEVDRWSNSIYIPNPNTPIKGNGMLIGWHFFARRKVQIFLQVWRKKKSASKVASEYQLIDQTEVHVKNHGLQSITPSDPIQVEEGDVTGFYFPGLSTIPFDGRHCHGDLRVKYMYTKPHQNAIHIGKVTRFISKKHAWRPCRSYSFSATVKLDGHGNNAKSKLFTDSKESAQKLEPMKGHRGLPDGAGPQLSQWTRNWPHRYSPTPDHIDSKSYSKHHTHQKHVKSFMALKDAENLRKKIEHQPYNQKPYDDSCNKFRFESCRKIKRCLNWGRILLESETSPKSTRSRLCRAVSMRDPKNRGAYTLTVNLLSEDVVYAGTVKGRLGLGVVFNVQDSQNFDYIVFRTDGAEGCYHHGYSKNGLIYDLQSMKHCPSSPPKSGKWFTVRLNVYNDNSALLYKDNHKVALIKPHFPATRWGGALVVNGYHVNAAFRDYRLTSMY